VTDTDRTSDTAPVGRRRRTPFVVAALIAVVALAVALPVFQPWKLVTNEVVDEALPSVSAQPSQPVAGDSASAAPTAASSTSSASPSAVTSPAASVSPSASPSSAPVVVARGTFISHEHSTSGSVRVLTLADGTTVLRIDGLDTSNGPDLRVWLSDRPVVDGPSGWGVFDDGAYVDLGSLKGNKGNQNYAIPPGTDLQTLSSVSIWCARFRVSFGAAALSA
jgi:hypothetical protein